MSRRLRVAVPESLFALSPRSGHGRMWASVLAALAGLVDLRHGGRPRADVWLISGHEAPSLPRRSRAPVVAQVHEASWADPELAGYLDPRMASALSEGTEAALARAAYVITPSEASRRQVSSLLGFDAERVVAVPHGVDATIFRPGLPGGVERVAAALDPADGHASSLPAPPPPLYVLFVGVVHPRKNLDALRGAMAQLVERGFPHVLAIAGSRPADRDDPIALLTSARAALPGAPGRVAWIAPGQDDPALAALMAGAAAFCLPSFGEGFGLPVLEAMACGVPVVVSDRGSLPEVVGDAGVVVAPEPEALADALAGVLDDPARSQALRAAARQRALTMSWERTAQGWASVLARAAERPAG